ncbi:glycosyltransferase family 2 protein, partial [Actinocorallia lasiicapitis]
MKPDSSKDARTSPALSVVVPFRDVEEYFGECLDSLARQTFTDLEVILVDDGSSDSSAVIAKEAVAADPRFQLVQQEAAGPGPARNAGVRQARGAYLAFADADDVVPRDAYRLMIASLERTGSDFATGAVERLEDGRLTASFLHRGLHAEKAERTHATKRPLLVRDRTPWNKVFRRSFWESHLFVFPSGLYEDPPVNVRAHAVAKAVDVLPDTVYHWRKRDGSITEERHGDDNLAHRLRSASLVRADLAANAPALLPAYDEHVVVDVELRVLLDAFARLTDPDTAFASGAVLAAALGQDTVDRLPSLDRLRLRLLATGEQDKLRELLRYQELGGPATAEVVQDGKRWYAAYPFRDELPRELFDVTDELLPVGRIDRCTWTEHGLEVEGHAYIRHLESEHAKLRVWLVAARKLGLVRVPVTRVDRPDVTAASGQSAVSHTASGFTGTVPASAFKPFGRARPADWTFYVEIVNQGVRRRRSLGNPAEQARQWPVSAELPGGLRADAVAGPGRYQVRVRAAVAEVTGHRVEDGSLVLEGRLPTKIKERPSLVAN